MAGSGRVWEAFLTEQDKAHLARLSDRRVGFGSRPALVLIDLYRWVFGDAPRPLLEAIDEWPGSCGLAAWEALPSIRRLLALARSVGLPVVHLTGLDDAGMPGWSEAAHGGPEVRPNGPNFFQQTGPWSVATDILRQRRVVPAALQGRGGGPSRTSPEAQERKRRRYDIVDEVAPIPGEVVLRKTSPSAFNGTPLLHHLNSLGVDTLIVGGESTSGCVRASVVDGCSYRFRVIVVEECVFDRHQATHAINLFDMHTKYADVLPLADVEAYLRGA